MNQNKRKTLSFYREHKKERKTEHKCCVILLKFLQVHNGFCFGMSCYKTEHALYWVFMQRRLFAGDLRKPHVIALRFLPTGELAENFVCSLLI